MTTLPLPSQTLARLRSRAEGGHDDARVLLHLIARADAQDQWFAKFTDSYSRTIAALCRRLEALERGATDLPAPAAPVDADPVANALLVAEAALADVAEGEAVSPRADECLHWAEARCTEALADIRSVMKECGIRTSEFPTAAPAPAPAAPTPGGGLLESIARIIASDSSEGPESFQGISKDVIHRVAAWLDVRGHYAYSVLLREEIIDQ